MNKEEILYKIVSVDSDFQKHRPDKVRTILNGEENGITYYDYDYKTHRYICTYVSDNFNIYDELENKNKEIDRLNNIINELEKWLYIEKNQYYEFYYKTALEDVLDKLKELKEGNKDENNRFIK